MFSSVPPTLAHHEMTVLPIPCSYFSFLVYLFCVIKKCGIAVWIHLRSIGICWPLRSSHLCQNFSHVKTSASPQFLLHSAYKHLIFHSTWPQHTSEMMCWHETGILGCVAPNRRLRCVFVPTYDLLRHHSTSKTYLERRHVTRGTNTSINNFWCHRLVSTWALSLLIVTPQLFSFF